MKLSGAFTPCVFYYDFLYSLLHVPFSAWRFVYLFIELCIGHNIHAREKRCTLCKMLHLGGGKCFASLSIFIVFIAFAEFLWSVKKGTKYNNKCCITDCFLSGQEIKETEEKRWTLIFIFFRGREIWSKFSDYSESEWIFRGRHTFQQVLHFLCFCRACNLSELA